MQRRNLNKRHCQFIYIIFFLILFFSCRKKPEKDINNSLETSCLEDNIIEKKYCLYYYQGKTFKVFFGKGIELNKKYNPDIVESVSDEEDSDNYTSFTQRTYSSVFDVRGVRIVKHLSFCRDSLFEVKIYSSTKKIDSLTTFVNKNMCIGEELKINKNDDFYSFSLLINNGNIIN